MRSRIYSILNIKASESKQVFDLLSVQFFVGLANAFMNIVAFTLFIYNFLIHELPVAYLGIAVLLIILNLIYEKLEHKLSSLQLFKVILVFSLTVIFFLWFGLSFGDEKVFIFLLLTCATLIYMITSYSFWGLVSLLFNVRESKRVFSVVGASDIPAKLFGYLFAPLLIPFLGLINLLWLSVLSLVVALLLFTRIIRKKRWDPVRKKSHADKSAHHAHSKKIDIVSFFFKNRLIFAISILSIISYNVFVLVDYTFITQVKIRFENIAQLAQYIAAFFAVGRFIALLFKLVFTSRLIERLGIISCLFITPVALFVFCIIFFIYGNESNHNILIFGVMAMLTEILRSTVQEPVFFILFQPLKEQLRLKGHIISKGYMLPPSLIIVGVTLFIFYKTGIPITIVLTIKILLANVIAWTLIIFFVKRTYLKTIHSSIKKGIFNSDEIYVYDPKVFDILLNKVKTGQKNEVIYALKLLEKAGYPKLDDLLQEQLHSNESEIKRYAMEQLDLLGKVNADILHAILPAETDITVKQKIVSLLCRYDPEYLKQASENLSGLGYDIRKIIIINLLNQQEFIYLLKAGTEINNLISSADPRERELAVNIITEIRHIQFTDAVEQLMNDPELSVKRAATVAACRLRVAKLLPAIIALLDRSESKYFAIKSLQLYGEALFADIQHIAPGIVSDHIDDFVKIAGKVKGPSSINFLLEKIDDGAPLNTEKVFHALWLQEYQPSAPAEAEKLHRSLNKYLDNGIEKINSYYQVPDFRDRDIIKRSIYSEVKINLITALKICVIIFRKKEINRIIELVQIERIDMLYNAMEMLELVLPKKVSRVLNSLFDFVLDPESTNKMFQRHDVKTFFNKILQSDSVAYNPWTKAVYMYYSWKNNEIGIFKNLRKENDPKEHLIIRETRDYVLSEINN